MALFNSKNQLGCAITDEILTVVSCTQHKRSIEAHKYAQVKLKKNCAKERVDIDLEQVENALQKISKSLKIKNCACIMSLPIRQTSFGFFKTQEKAQISEAKKLLKKHIFSCFTVHPEAIRFKEWLIPHAGSNGLFIFGYSAIERSIIDSWKQLFSRSGLYLRNLVIDTPSIFELLRQQEYSENSEEIKAIIDVGELSTVCLVGSSLGVQRMDCLPWGLRDAYKKNNLSGLENLLQQTIADFFNEYPRKEKKITWYVSAPDELLKVFQQFLTSTFGQPVLSLGMIIEIPPRFRIATYMKAVAATSAPKMYSFKV